LVSKNIETLGQEIRALAEKRDALILAHNYQRPEVQDIADFVGDSLGLSREAAKTRKPVLVFCGVHFMAETAAILSPSKRVLLPDLAAGCSLADTISAAQVRAWKDRFPGYVTLGYVNTTAEVKAELDYCCTSGNVLSVIDAIPEGPGILFLPDFFLGMHARRMRPDRRIEVWMGECHVHAAIRPGSVEKVRREHPGAEVLVHPECGCAGSLIESMGAGEMSSEGVHVASTEQMIQLSTRRPAKTFVVATEVGMLHRLRLNSPDKEFLPADPEASCSFMKTITLEKVRDALALDQYEVVVPEATALRARRALDRMVSFG
jgi:quinolinate synthase